MQHKSDSSGASTSKPSLMSKPSFSSKQAGDTEEPSILSSVKSSSATPVAVGSAPKTSKFKLITVGAVAITAAYFGYQYTLGTQQSTKPNAKSSVIIDEKAEAPAKTQPLATAQPSSTVSNNAAPNAVALAPEAAAQIINEPAPSKPTIANSEGKLTAALEDGVKPPNAAIEKALASPAPALATAKPSGAENRTAIAKVPPAKATANKPAEASANNKAAGTPAADKDVSLIAALLSHGTGVAAKPKAAAAPSASASAPASAAVSPNAEPASASLDATTIALKQCAELNFIEREVCRVKTCNNQWETNAACKATMSTASAKP